MLILEDCRIYGKNRKVLINEAKRRTVYIDPRIYYERTLGTVNSTIAHECYHWHRHQPCHMLMKAIGHNSKLGKNIKCAIETNKRDSKKWNAEEWLEWQANDIVM